jgi:hypothetical protein
MQADILRGISDDPVPPDPNDFREYVSINVGMERATRQPAYITFLVDPRAQSDQGIFVALTKTTETGKSWTWKIDQGEAVRLPICECNSNACIARIPQGVIQNGTGSINLLEEFLKSDSLLVLYVRDGMTYRTAVLLSPFKREYQRVLTTEFK